MTPRALRAAAAVLIVIVGIWAGVRVYTALSSSKPLSGGVRVPIGEVSPPTATDVAAGLDDRPPAVTIPERLPEFSLQDRDGKLTSIRAWVGKSLIINFWATWCAPCRHEIPLLKALNEEWANRGTTVVGIAVDHREQVRTYAEEFKIAYPILVGEQDALDVATSFGVAAPVFPFTVFTDIRGEVVALYVGELHKSQADLILAVVQNLNQNQVDLPTARRSIADGLQALSAGKPG